MTGVQTCALPISITILEEVIAQYEVIDIFPSLERTKNLEKMIQANKDNVYASDVQLDCYYECTEIGRASCRERV